MAGVVTTLKVRLPKDDAATLKRMAKARKQTVDEFILLCIREHPVCLDAEGRLYPYAWKD